MEQEENAKPVTTEKVVEKVEDQELPVFPDIEVVEDSKTSKFKKESVALFKEYPDAVAFHFTSDGLAFFQHNDARNYASTLEDKEVISKVRK